jgi:hypothetical protein
MLNSHSFRNLSDNVRDIVIPFFKDDTDDEKVNHVKYKTFNLGGCASIMQEDHHVYQAFNTLERLTVDGPPALARAHDHARTRRHTRQGARPRRPPGLSRPSPSTCQTQAQPAGKP